MEKMKFKVSGEEQSKALQNVLFNLGYYWVDGKNVKYLDSNHIYAGDDGYYLSYGCSASCFVSSENKEYDTQEFINKHTKEPAKMEFDINVPIERQFTRDGRKVLAIFNSGLDITYPITAFIEGEEGSQTFKTDGSYYADYSCHHDIITRPEVKPNVVKYANVYPNNGHELGCSYDTADKANKSLYTSTGITYKFTFNPNDETLIAEKV